MSGSEKIYVQTRHGEVVAVSKADAKAKLESGEYLPATAEDKAEAEKRERNSTISAKAKTFGESAAAAAIDTGQAPIALPLRATAALWGDEDPLRDISGRPTLEHIAGLAGGAKRAITGEKSPWDNGVAESAREYGANARERAEANPHTATAGNVAGALAAGGALSGGAGAVGAGVSESLGGGLLARAGGALVSGAIEGAGYGQAQAGEEAYLRNVPLSGEKLVASMGWGALLGGGVSLASHGVGALIRRGSRGATPLDTPRLGEGSDLGEAPSLAPADAAGLPLAPVENAPNKLSGALRDFADERTAKALGARGSTLKKLGRTAEKAESTMHDMAQAVRGATLEDGTLVFQPLQSQSELAERVAQATRETGAKLGTFREQADKVFEAHPEIAPHADSIADRIESQLVQPLEKHPLSSARSQAAPIRQVVNDIRALGAQAAQDGAPVKVSDLTKLRQGLDDQIYQAKRGVNLTQQGAPPNLKDLERARGILEESIEASSDKAATMFDRPAAQSYKALKTQWRHLNLASDIAGSAELQDLGNRVVSPSDYGAGIGAGAMGGGPVGAIATGLAHKAVREHSSAVLAVLADKLANTLDGKIESGLGAFFREASARSEAGIGNVGKAAAAVPIRRIATPAAVDAFMGRSKDLAAAYDKRVAELSDANRDMGAGVRASMQTAMGGGYEAMPRLTQAATVTATRGAQYLQSQLPGGTSAPTAFQPSRKSSPSDLQIREFAQKWAAVANPLSVVDDLRRGTVTHAQIDALKAVYPQMYAEVQQKALEKCRELDASGKRMPFNDRLQLDLFLDLNGAGEPTLAGQFVDRIAGLQAAKQKQEAQQKPHASGGALSKLGVSRQSGAAALGEP